VPASSAPAYTAPAYTPVVPAVPESSAPAYTAPAYTPVVPEVPAYTAPAYTPAVPEVASVVVSSSVSTSCTESTEAAYTPVVPASSAPAYSAPAYTPVVPAVPASSAPAYTAPAYPVVPEVPASSAPAYTPVVPSVTKPAYTAPAYTPAPAPSSVVHSSAVVVSSAKPKPSKPASGGSYDNGGRVVTNGNYWAMTYTPYASNGDCKSASEVKGDIAKIAQMGFTTIRSYSTDCGVFENVVPACAEHGLKVIFGIFLTGGGATGKGPFSPYADEQLQAIIKNAPKDLISMIIVGNEFLFNGYGTANELASYIDHVRDECTAAGFPSDIAITTTEPVAQMIEFGAILCSHMDVFTVQIHPFFNSGTLAGEAGDFAVSQLALAAAVCPEAAAKGQYITEIGWPSAGDANGVAIPGKAEQKAAMKSILEKVGKESCIFSFQNDLWKAPGALNVEQAFGCADAL
jgi:exo-beta-1,3-glucanase (GH17 family)